MADLETYFAVVCLVIVVTVAYCVFTPLTQETGEPVVNTNTTPESQSYDWDFGNGNFSSVENDNNPAQYFSSNHISPVPTPTYWNDTRREAVGLPPDGYGNPCPCKTPCTPTITPTPTGTPVCEFPWWCEA